MSFSKQDCHIRFRIGGDACLSGPPTESEINYFSTIQAVVACVYRLVLNLQSLES